LLPLNGFYETMSFERTEVFLARRSFPIRGKFQAHVYI